jgi:hypothetical protein
MPEPARGGGADSLQTIQLRKFGGINQTDARTAIGDELTGGTTEFFWLENAMPVGAGNIRIIPNTGSVMSVVTPTIASMWGFSLNQGGGPLPVILTVHTDGSMAKIDTVTGTQLAIAAAGTVTSKARLTAWQDSQALIIDPDKGYFASTGTNCSVVSTSITGSDIAVFEGRVWIVTGSRSIEFSEPDSYTNFAVTGGAGTATVADSVFPGKIYRLLSALEQLWIVGAGAIDAISNVQTASGITTFSLTNIVSSVGSTHPSSVTSFFRTFLFLNHYGIYAIVGATPQKLSDKLDGFWAAIDFTLGDDPPAAVTTIYDVFVWCALVPITDPFDGTTRSILLCFAQGKWFFADQGALTWITGLLSDDGDPEIWGTDGHNVFKLFADAATTIDYRIMSKLFDFGSALQRKQWLRVGLEINSSSAVSATLTAETEENAKAVSLPLTGANVVSFVGAGPITFVGAGPIQFVTAGLQLFRQQVTGGLLGRYLGATLTGTSAPFTLSALQMQIKPSGAEWN